MKRSFLVKPVLLLICFMLVFSTSPVASLAHSEYTIEPGTSAIFTVHVYNSYAPNYAYSRFVYSFDSPWYFFLAAELGLEPRQYESEL